jgi:hypothetical protein
MRAEAREEALARSREASTNRLGARACREDAMSEQKWTVEKVRQEVYDIRTKLFVITKVLETGALDLKAYPEWALVIEPLLRETVEYAEQIRATCVPEQTPSTETSEQA